MATEYSTIADPVDETQRRHEAAGGTGLVWLTIPNPDHRNFIVQNYNKMYTGQIEFWAEQHIGVWWLFKRPIQAQQ